MLNKKGFTLIELLVVISIIGFLVVASVLVFNIVRMNARDVVRAGNVSVITRALAVYLNDSTTGYPASTGECLSPSSGVGSALKTAKVLLAMPVDPLWPTNVPNPVPNTTPPYTTDSNGFCYYYVSTATTQFQLYYFLESNSKSGSAGPNLRTQ